MGASRHRRHNPVSIATVRIKIARFESEVIENWLLSRLHDSPNRQSKVLLGPDDLASDRKPATLEGGGHRTGIQPRMPHIRNIPGK